MNFPEEIRRWADSREVSDEIAVVIWQERKTDRGRQRLWYDPTRAERRKIIEQAWKLSDEAELFWGPETMRRT